MSKQSALFWLSVTILLSLGILVGQSVAVMVAATAAVAIAWRQILPETLLPETSVSR